MWWRPPLLLHLFVGLLVVAWLAAAHVSGSGESFVAAYVPAFIAVWLLVAAAIGLLSGGPKGFRGLSWFLALIWPAVAWFATLGLVTLLG